MAPPNWETAFPSTRYSSPSAEGRAAAFVASTRRRGAERQQEREEQSDVTHRARTHHTDDGDDPSAEAVRKHQQLPSIPPVDHHTEEGTQHCIGDKYVEGDPQCIVRDRAPLEVEAFLSPKNDQLGQPRPERCRPLPERGTGLP